jgi:outer membrane protein OmpA-like peptidoglycan-associated protein
MRLELREMSEDDEDATYPFEVPAKYRHLIPLIIPFLELTAKVQATATPQALAESKPEDDIDHAGLLAKEIVELLRKQGTTAKNSSPHGLVLLVIRLVQEGRGRLAERAIEAAQSDKELSNRIQEFFKALPEDERPEPLEAWPGKLRELLSKPQPSILGEKAAGRIASRKYQEDDPDKNFYILLRNQVESKVNSGQIPKAVLALLTSTIILTFGTSHALAWGFPTTGSVALSTPGGAVGAKAAKISSLLILKIVVAIGAIGLVAFVVWSLKQCSSAETPPKGAALVVGSIDAPRSIDSAAPMTPNSGQPQPSDEDPPPTPPAPPIPPTPVAPRRANKDSERADRHDDNDHEIVIKDGKLGTARPINFKFDSVILINDSPAVLDKVVDFLRKHPNILRLEISGHTTNVGAEYNLRLSEKRAATVRDYLIDRGIDPARLVTRGYAGTQPIAGNAPLYDDARNQRVEFKILDLKR